MEEFLDFPLEELSARIAVGDPKAEAYAWLHAYADQLVPAGEVGYDDDPIEPVCLNELYDAFINDDYISRGGLFEGESIDPTFFDKVSILTGKHIPAKDRNNFFSCSC